MVSIKSLISFIFVGIVLSDDRVRYDGYTVLDVTPHTYAHLATLQRVSTLKAFETQVWREANQVGRSAHIMVASTSRHRFTKYLQLMGMKVKVMIADVQSQIDYEAATAIAKTPFTKDMQPKDFTLNQYHTYDEIAAYLQSIAKAYPNITTLTSIGKSTQKRDLWLLKIGKPGTNGTKNGFWIDAGIHAREWVAPTTALYIINQLVTNYGTDASYTKLMDSIDFYILPVFNPDGYQYTHTADRLWRKTRSGPYCEGDGNECCYGVDANRNWDFQWGGQGTSSDPCDEIYTGPKPFSEPECLAGSVYLTKMKDVLKAMITLHSYSEDILYPYGYAVHTYPPDVAELKALGDLANAACQKVHGTSYAVVNSADSLYPAAGASDDWSKNLGIKWVYTIELRPGPGDNDDDEHYGFVLPAKFIIRTADEIWAAILVMANRVMTGPN